MTLNVKYRPLKAFLLAAETRSFSRAADRLGITQPSFTALIRDLEAVLEIRLFERTTRSVSLTAAGEDFCDRVQRPIADLEEAYRSIADLAAVRRGAIAIGALPSIALTLIPPTLGKLRMLHPGLKVRVLEAHNAELLTMLRTNQIEFALATLLDDASEFTFLPLMVDWFFALYPPHHPAASRPTLRWKDLVPYDLVLLSQSSSARHQFERAVQDDEGFAGRRYDVTNMTTAVLLVRQLLGVAILPRLALPVLHVEGLCFRAIEDDTAQRTLSVVHRRDRQLSPAGLEFCKQLQSIAADAASVLPAPSSPAVEAG